MLREIAHFLVSAPTALVLKARLSQQELYDAVMAGAEAAGLRDLRRELVGDLDGDVLEVGAGTGLMFEHYGERARVVAIEPDADFAARAAPRIASSRAGITMMSASAEELPFEDARFDAIVAGLVLCSVSDVAGALSEMARVLRPGGEVRLIEHVRSERAIAGKLMDLLDPVWLRLNGQGCHMNRATVDALADAGYALRDVRPFQVFAAGLPAFPMRWIRAAPLSRSG